MSNKSSEDSLSAKLSTDTIVGGIMNVLSKAQGLILLPVIIGTLGIDAYGAVSQLLVLLSVLVFIFRLDLPQAYVHFYPDIDNSSSLYTTLLITLAITSVFSTFLLTSLADTISSAILNTQSYEALFKIGLLSLPLKVLSDLSDNQLRAARSLKWFSTLRAIRSLLELGAIIITVLFISEKLAHLALAIVVGNLLYYIPVQIFALHSEGLGKPEMQKLKRSLSYSLPLTASKIGEKATSIADRFIIGALLGPGAVGLYSATYGIANVILTYQQPISTVFFPEFSRLFALGKIDEANSYLETGVKYYLFLGIPSVIGIGIVGEELLELVANETIASEGLIPLIVLSGSILLFGLEQIFSTYLSSVGRTVSVSLSKVSSAVLNIGLNLVLIPELGVLGAVVATFISYLYGSVLGFGLSNYFTGISFPIINAIKILCFSLLMGGALYLINHSFPLDGPQVILLNIIIGVVLYMGLSVYSGTFDPATVKDLQG